VRPHGRDQSGAAGRQPDAPRVHVVRHVLHERAVLVQEDGAAAGHGQDVSRICLGMMSYGSPTWSSSGFMKFPEHVTFSFLLAQCGPQQQYGWPGTALVILAGNLPAGPMLSALAGNLVGRWNVDLLFVLVAASFAAYC